MKSRTPFALALFALAVSPLTAQKQAPPPPGKPKDFQLPARREFTLDNGMAVTLVPYGTVPKVTVELGIRTGNIDEGPKQIWLADLTGDLLTQGTASHSATEIAEAAARMGGSLDVNVAEDRTNIGGDVLSEAGPEMVALIADVVRHPTFPEKEVARLKGDRERRLSIARSQPQQLAAEKFREVLYGDHPYGHLFPTAEMLAGYTVEQVRAFYDANFGAARAHLYAVGRFDEKALEAAVRRAFGDWKRGTPPSAKPPRPKGGRAVYEIDRPGAVQSTLNVGLPVIDPSHADFIALLVTNALLGGSFSSRITSNIREQKGYTYSPNSQVSVRYRDGFWVEVADVTTKDTGASLKEIFHEIERLTSEPPSPEELKGIQNYLAGTFVLQGSSRTGIIGQLEFVNLHGLPEDYLTGYVRMIYAVTPTQVQQMTAKYIRPDQTAIVVVGDRKVVDEQVAPFQKTSS